MAIAIRRTICDVLRTARRSVRRLRRQLTRDARFRSVRDARRDGIDSEPPMAGGFAIGGSGGRLHNRRRDLATRCSRHRDSTAPRTGSRTRDVTLGTPGDGSRARVAPARTKSPKIRARPSDPTTSSRRVPLTGFETLAILEARRGGPIRARVSKRYSIAIDHEMSLS